MICSRCYYQALVIKGNCTMARPQYRFNTIEGRGDLIATPKRSRYHIETSVHKKFTES